MGNQPSSNFIAPLSSQRSLSAISQVNSQMLIRQSNKATKHINVRNNQELKILKTNFQFRLKNHHYLAHMYGFQLGDSQQQGSLLKISCKSLFKPTKITMYYDKITMKFQDLYNINVQQGIELLIHCLKGFQILYEHYGYFRPEAMHIFKQGDNWVVWISDDIFSIKEQIKDKGQDNLKQRSKFWRKIIHLFDLLRDQEHPNFSYSLFVYGNQRQNGQSRSLQLPQILQRLNEIRFAVKRREKQQNSSRKENLNSFSTIRKEKVNTLQSQEQVNDTTLQKFNTNKKQTCPKLTKMNHQVAEENLKSKSVVGQQRSLKPKQNNLMTPKLNESISKQEEFINFRRVESQLIKQADQNQQLRQTINKKHAQISTPISKLSNLTGREPVYAFVKNQNKIDKEKGNFNKRERSMTIDLANKNNPCIQNLILQPRKITQNSQGTQSFHSQIEQTQFNLNSVSKYSHSNGQSHDKQVYNKQKHLSQYTQSNQKYIHSKTPSICEKTKKYTIKNNFQSQDYYIQNPKIQHRRSRTDEIPLQGPPKKVKQCLSQQFDSQFYSTYSKKQNLIPSKLQISEQKFSTSKKQHTNSQLNIEIEKPQNKFRRVTILGCVNKKKSFHEKKDQINENSETDNSYLNPNEPSIRKLTMLKSQGGLKSILGTNLFTLKSIKQIDVQVPIDQEILYDLNKMFPRHYFSKNSKQSN